MKVCLVNLGALPALSEEHKHERIGGEEVQHAQLASALSRLGYDVRLVVADLGQPDGASYQGVQTVKAFREAEGLPIVRFVYPRWIKLWSALVRADSDVYYCSTASMLVGLIAMYCRLYNKRFVFRTAIDSDCEPKRLLIRYRRDRWLYEFGLKRASTILVQTATQQRTLLENYGLLGSIADMLVARPQLRSVPLQKDIDVLWISNLRQIKRPDRLIEIAKAMPDYRFHMAGGPSPGEEDLYQRLEADAQHIPNLVFHGAVPYLDVGALFDRAKVFANTSDLEGFPNTFLQAWIRGIPVVTMFDPDAIVARARLGSSHSTVEDMVDGLKSILCSDGAYRSASSAALEFMGERFDEKTVLAPYLNALANADRVRRQPQALERTG